MAFSPRLAYVLRAFLLGPCGPVGIQARLAQPPEVKVFARHYAKAVRRLAAAKRETEEAEDAEAIV